MPVPTPQEFHDRALAHADADRRLPMPDQSMWEIFPFEPDSLTVKPLDPLTLPEPARAGEAGRDCWRCDRPDEGVAWSNERWPLMPFEQSRLPFAVMLMPRAHLDLADLDDDMAAELGVLTVRVVRAVEALTGIGADGRRG